MKLGNDGKASVRLYSTSPPLSRLSWSLFEGPTWWTRLYLHLDLSIERRHMDNPLRHSCLPVVYFLLFYVGVIGLLSASVFGLVIVRDGGLLFCRIAWGFCQREVIRQWQWGDFMLVKEWNTMCTFLFGILVKELSIFLYILNPPFGIQNTWIRHLDISQIFWFISWTLIYVFGIVCASS
jgi:hypothetical protein